MYYNKLMGKLESELPNPLFHPDGRKTNNPTPDQYAKYYCIAIMPTTPEGMVIIGGSEQVHYDEETNSATVSYQYETLEAKQARDQAEQTEREAKDATAELNRINNKSKELKTAENDFLTLVQTINQQFELNITPDDGFKEVMEKLKNSTTGERLDRLEAGLELRTLWDVVLFRGGRWGDVQFHDLSVYDETEPQEP